MIRKLAIEPEAEAEIADSADWYNDQDSQLRQRFIRAVGDTLRVIADNPETYQVVIKPNIRRAPIAGFPYILIYRLTPEEIAVVACIHGRRDPEFWRSRL